MTDFTSVSDHEWFEVVESALDLVANTIEMSNPVSRNLPHCFVGIQQFDGGAAPVVATAGTYQVFIRTINTEIFEELCDSPIEADSPRTINFAANLSGVRVVPLGIAGTPVTYKVVVTANGN